MKFFNDLDRYSRSITRDLKLVILLLIFFFLNFARGYGADVVIWKGSFGHFLTPSLEFNTDIRIISGSTDPTSSAVDAPAGSLYLRTNGSVYRKTDPGSSTNWANVTSSTSATLQDSTFTIFDNSDNTKLAQFQVSGISPGTTRIFTFPDADITFLGTSDTATVTNKTLGSTNTLTGATAANFTNTGTVTLPTATTTLVGRDTTDTLTGKTIDADGTGNSISNIENADIKSSAAIALTKLAATTVSKALVSDGSGVISPATTTSTEIGYVNGVTSSLCGINQSCTLTNKTLDADDNTISDIDNGEIKAAAGIDVNKLAAVTSSRALVSDGSGFVSPATTTATEIGFVNGVTSSIQTQLDSKASSLSPVLTTPQINDTSSDHQYVFAVSELAADRTVTLPLLAGNDEFLFKDFAATITNKTLGSTNTLTGATAGSFTNTGTITLPTNTTTLVGRDTTDTLTNKTINADGTGNSITNIENADIKSAAGITFDKLAATTAQRAVITDTNGFIAAASTIETSELAFLNNVSSSLCGVSQTCSMTNKTISSSGTVSTAGVLRMANNESIGWRNNTNSSNITITVDSSNIFQFNRDITTSGKISATTYNLDGGTAGNTNRIILPSDTTANLDSLTDTAGLIAFDSSQSRPVFNNGSSWTIIGGGNSSGINYILNPDAETGTTGWTGGTDAAASIPTDLTGGTDGGRWTRSTSSPLRGTGSFLFTHPASNIQGEFVSFPFTIDSADQGKVLNITFDYTLVSGTFVSTSSSSDLIVYIFDVTNSVLIQPANIYIQGVTAGVMDKHIATFQSSSNSTSYRFGIFAASTNTSSFVMKFDNFSIGPQTINYGPAVTEWVSETCSSSWVTNTTVTCKTRRVGDSLEVQAKVLTSGDPTSTTLTIGLPSGKSIDTNKVVDTGLFIPESSVTIRDSGTENYDGKVVYNDSTSVAVYKDDGDGTISVVNATSPFTFGANDNVEVSFKVPIAGWGGTVQMSESSDTRVVAANVYLSANQSIGTTSSTKVTFDTVQKDSHGLFQLANNRIIITTPGTYRLDLLLSYTNVVDASHVHALIYKTGNIVARGTNNSSSGTTDFGAFATTTVDLVAGDYIEGFTSASSDSSYTVLGNTEHSRLTVSRISGNQTIAASETVSMSYETNTAQTLEAAGGGEIIIYEDKIWDSHGIYNPATGVATIPQAGVYNVICRIGIDNATWTQGDDSYLTIRVDSTEKKTGFYRFESTTGASYNNFLDVTGDVRVLAGQTIDCFSDHNRTGGDVALNTAPTFNYISIRRVANY